jgi:hypothetical protein
MPLISACHLPPPSNWQDFESLCSDLWAQEWNDHNVQRIGRIGQAQNGVDICGRLNTGWVGIQCKNIGADSVLSEKVIRDAVDEAKTFVPQLAQFLISTTGLKDAKLEALCRELTEQHTKLGFFSVAIFSWSDICMLLERHPAVARVHFPFAITSVAPILLKNEGGDFDVDLDKLQYSFSRREFVHPRIVEELLGFMSDRHETVTSVYLESANNSNRFFGAVETTQDSDGVWVKYEEAAGGSFMRQPYFRYKHIGTSQSGIHILRTMWNGGGSGHFNDLCFLAFRTDEGVTLDAGSLHVRKRLLLKTLGSIPIGDRFCGTIEFKNGVLNVGRDEKSYGCLKEGFSLGIH